MEKILSSAMAVEEINKRVERKNEIVDKIAEKRTEFEATDVDTREEILDEVKSLEEEANQIDEEVKDLNEQKEKFEAQEERMSMVNVLSAEAVEARKAVVNEDKLDTPEYRKAWKDYIVTGKDTEVRALTTATDNVPIPTIMQGYVETAWEKYGKFSRIVNKTRVAGYLRIPVELSADPADIHAEGAQEPQEENITFGQIALNPVMIKKWISLTDELIAMTPEEFMRYIADELVYQVILALDHGIINGLVNNDGDGVVGIVENTNTIKVEEALGFNAINAAIAELNVFDNLTVAMNPKTFYANLLSLTDLQGRPIFQVSTDNAGKPLYLMNGQRVEFTTALPAYDDVEEGKAWAVVGDFRGYRLNLPEGDMVRTLVDPYTLATEDKVRMIGRLYAAGNVVKLKHFAQLNKPEA